MASGAAGAAAAEFTAAAAFAKLWAGASCL